jgi:hypothetical protein
MTLLHGAGVRGGLSLVFVVEGKTEMQLAEEVGGVVVAVGGSWL